MTLVDTNVLLDVVTNDPVWASWSLRHLDIAAIAGPLAINDVVYAELSVGFPAIEQLDAILRDMEIQHQAISRPALFLAGKAFLQYRARGGHRPGILPDFFIGAHAAAMNLTLLTRDARRVRSYFPTVRLIAPDV